MAKLKRLVPIRRGAPAWMITFCDLMTLLLCFFVLLFGLSSIDSTKFAAFVNSYTGSTGLLPGAEIIVPENGMLGGGIEATPKNDPLDKEDEDIELDIDIEKQMEVMTSEIQNYIDAEDLVSRVRVEQDGEEVILTFEDFLIFDPGMADIKADAIPVLDSVGIKIREYLDDGYVVRSEGHTDNIPINTPYFPSNWELSAARAISVAKFYIDELGFEPRKISAEGFGEYYPIATNDTAEGRDENRRVELRIIRDSLH